MNRIINIGRLIALAFLDLFAEWKIVQVTKVCTIYTLSASN